MSALKQLQDGFAAAMLCGDPAIGEKIVSDADATAGERLEIYGNAYVARLQEALEADYPVLLERLGDDFYHLTREYIRAHPSEHPSIRWFGRRLLDFVSSTQPWCDQPELIELVSFEWAQSEVFDAAGSEPANIEQLAAIPPEQWGDIRLRFVPALRRLDLRSNVVPRWVALRHDDTPPELQLEAQPQGWLVWRKGLDPHWRSLEVGEAWALDQCLRGMSFGELCAGLCEWIDEAHAPLRAVSLLKTWLADEIVAGIDISE